MNRREKDLQKVLGYTKLLDIEVVYVDETEGDVAGLYYPRKGPTPPKIHVSTKKQTVFRQLLTILHELGHHIDLREGEWSDQDDKAVELVFDKLNEAPEWAKRRFWDLEERANWNLLRIAEHLEIELPPFLFWYDIEKLRAYIKLEFKIGKVPKKLWKEEKRKIRERLLENTPPISSYKIISY